MKDILDEDEDILKLLAENAMLHVKVGKTIGNEIKTNSGVPQGDCLSPILFITYLAEASKPLQAIEVTPHISDYTFPKIITSGASKCNHAYILGVAQLHPRP